MEILPSCAVPFPSRPQSVIGVTVASPSGVLKDFSALPTLIVQRYFAGNPPDALALNTQFTAPPLLTMSHASVPRSVDDTVKRASSVGGTIVRGAVCEAPW